MKIAANADSQQKEIFLMKGIPGDVSIYWLQEGESIPEADAYFDLQGEDTGSFPFSHVKDRPVFVNAVITTPDGLPADTVRINTWPGFFTGDRIEINAGEASLNRAATVLETMGWSYEAAPDTPGMIAARVVAMIINEAYFALGEGVSTKQEIDTAMKLGTNYPYGPFEWSDKIGLQKIYRLLQKLGNKNTRYDIAPKLIDEYKLQINK